MPASDAYERLQPKTRAEWRRWLTKHHASAPGVWVVSWKKGAPGVSPPYDEVVQEALCFGWIDSRPLRIDDERHALLYTPRKPRSVWAASNKGRVEQLIAAGKMRPAGLAAIEVAQANGSWDALTAIDANIEPDDLVAALKRNKTARKHWDAFPPGERRRIAYWITSAKRPETRAKRVEETVTLAAQNVRANVWVPKEQR
ncbi:MAG: YdeI/OmpD-associated family protein, partial [Chloroflexota bacterium]